MVQPKRRGRPPHDDVLTPAEWRAARAAQHGLSNRDIARRQGVSINAIKFHIANVLAKLGLEDKKALRGWFGVPKSSAMYDHGKCRDTDMSLGTIGQISRTVSDIKASSQWYENVLGLPHMYSFDNIAFFDCDGTRLFLTQAEKVSESESVIYLRVDDIRQAHEQLVSRGVKFISAPHMIHQHDDGTEEWMAFFEDPDGRPLAIMSQVAGRNDASD